MSKKLWWETHALLLGKLTGDLLSIELSARLMIAKQEVGGDLKKTRPQLPKLQEGDWVEITPITNKADLTWALDKYNSCVKRKHPELIVHTKSIVFLRDALAHGRAFGVLDHKSGPHLRLLRFSRDTNAKHDKVQVTLRVDMTKDWFDAQAKMLSQVLSKIAKALEFSEKELGKFSDS